MILAWALTMLVSVPSIGAEVGAEVVVHLNDGRTARGVLDPATSDEMVVLTTSLPGIRVTSRFETDRVERVVDAAAHDAETGTIRFELPVEPRRGTYVRSRRAPRVKSLFVEARVENFDRDAEVDGLLVRVVPLDEFGHVVPVDGWLSFDLTVRRYRSRDRLPWRERERDRLVDEVERWGETVGRADFGPDGAYVKLPFRHLRPERETVIASIARLGARLVVRGQGAFEAVDGHVRLFDDTRFDSALGRPGRVGRIAP